MRLWEGRYEDHDATWLRWCDRDGHPIPAGAERAEEERRRAEQEHERAEEERRRAEQEYQRAEEERRRAEQEHERAEEERQRAEQAYQELERLKEQMRRSGIEPPG